MRIRKLLALSVAGLLLTGARAPVFPLPDALLPDETQTFGQPFSVKPGDVILRAKIVRTEKSYLDKPFVAELDRFRDDLPVGSVLTTVISNDDTKKVVGSSTDAYYCGEDIKARSSFMAGFIGDFGSKFENIVRFCFLDEDGDSALDHYFLAGAKDPALLAKRPIDPLPFHVERLVHENDADEIRLRYRKFEPATGEVHLELEITRNGKPFHFQYIITPKHMGSDQQYYRLQTRPKKIPYPMHFSDILGADVGIRSVDENGQATIIVYRPFEPSLIKPYTPEVHYFFVYI